MAAYITEGVWKVGNKTISIEETWETNHWEYHVYEEIVNKYRLKDKFNVEEREMKKLHTGMTKADSIMEALDIIKWKHNINGEEQLIND